MTKEDAVGLGKELPHPFLDVVAWPCPMAQGDCLPFKLDKLFEGERQPCPGVAAVAMDGMNGFAGKALQYTKVCQVAGMKDVRAVREGACNCFCKKV